MKFYFKNSIYFIAVVLCIICVQDTSLAQQPAAVNGSNQKKVRVEVIGAKLRLNGQLITFPTTKETLSKLLGKPSRVTSLVNTVYTWDDAGLFVYEQEGTDKVFSLAICLNDLPAATPSHLKDLGPKHWAKSLFSGELIIDDAVVTQTSKIKDVNRAKKGKRFITDLVMQPFIFYKIGHPSLLISALEQKQVTMSIEIAQPLESRR